MSHQLPLPLGDVAAASDPTTTPPARLRFPIATEGGSPFDDEARFFEPWWPGAMAFLRHWGDGVEIHTEHLSDPLLAFPELRGAVAGLEPRGTIVQGTLLALDAEGRPDARLLRQRLRDAGGPAVGTVGAFVASDLLYAEGRPMAGLPFVERRRRLASMLADTSHCVVSRGVVGEGVTLAHAVASLGLAAISARRLDGRWRPGSSGDDWLRLPVTEPPSEPTRPFLVLLERLPLAS